MIHTLTEPFDANVLELIAGCKLNKIKKPIQIEWVFLSYATMISFYTNFIKSSFSKIFQWFI